MIYSRDLDFSAVVSVSGRIQGAARSVGMVLELSIG